MIVVSGTFFIDSTRRDEALAVAETMASASRREDGCIAYAFWVDAADASRFRVFEEWVDADALEAHFATEHAQTLMDALAGVGAHSSDVWRYEVTGKSRLV
ncbi:MAG: putative quinol monooxygenase [Acidimicrobiia bacterium]